MDDKLVLLAMEAINAPQKWSQVLAHLMAATGAKAATITLRDGKTCQIVNDDALMTEYHSPLVCGFPLEAISYYLQELRRLDTWAEVQRTHYPERPALMSRVLDPETVPDQRFFTWLQSVGITDTVVFELERMSGFWTACNLFLGPQTAAQKQAVLDYAGEHYSFLRKAWQASQSLVQAEQVRHVAFDQLARMSIAACITGATGEVLRTNALFDALIDRKQVALLGPKRRLVVPRAVRQHGGAAWLATAVSDTLETAPALAIWATPFAPDPRYRERREPRWFLAFGKAENSLAAPLEPRDDVLTAQERALLRGVQAGATVAQAGAKIGVKRSRAFDIWAVIKRKLDIENAHQIRLRTAVAEDLSL